jgi:hypothetical protein
MNIMWYASSGLENVAPWIMYIDSHQLGATISDWGS